MPTLKDEPVDVGTLAEAVQVKDPEVVKAYLTTYTKVKVADLAKEVWVKPEDIIGAAVKAHGATLESYRNSGLG